MLFQNNKTLLCLKKTFSDSLYHFLSNHQMQRDHLIKINVVSEQQDSLMLNAQKVWKRLLQIFSIISCSIISCREIRKRSDRNQCYFKITMNFLQAHKTWCYLRITNMLHSRYVRYKLNHFIYLHENEIMRFS